MCIAILFRTTRMQKSDRKVNESFVRYAFKEQTMQTRDDLHQLVDSVPEPAIQIAARSLTAIASTATAPEGASVCRSWNDVARELDSFPALPLEFNDEDGEPQPMAPRWAFRGQANSSWPLLTSLERLGQEIDSGIEEHALIRAFKAKARLYVAGVPDTEDALEWLALMQHHGVPTRLLDFTYSPYLAAYFALRDDESGAQFAEIWGIRLDRLDCAARAVYGLLGNVKDSTGLLKFPLQLRKRALSRTWGDALVFDKNGFIVSVNVRSENARLSHQQGVFLLNGAKFPFQESLFRMMRDCNDTWLRRIWIDRRIREDALRKLFQMNIHELALFPDLDGLAKFVRQRSRLFGCRKVPEL